VKKRHFLHFWDLLAKKLLVKKLNIGEIDLGVYFTNNLRGAFGYESVLRSFSLLTVYILIFVERLLAQKP